MTNGKKIGAALGDLVCLGLGLVAFGLLGLPTTLCAELPLWTAPVFGAAWLWLLSKL